MRKRAPGTEARHTAKDARIPSTVRAVIQRVARAEVRVAGETVASIGPGLCVLVGVADGDDRRDAAALADKIAGLRIFPDDHGKMNLSVVDVGGRVLVVSQFTLLGEVRRGRRPSFDRAAPAETAEPLVEKVADRLAATGIPVATGRFGALMEVELVNHGPVTLIVETVDGRVV